jgi:PII-like signaling protein
MRWFRDGHRSSAEEDAMQGLKGERVLMRIHIGERDKYHGRPLYQAIVELLRERHYAGATVLRAIMGFGSNSRIRTDRIETLSLDLPVIVECVDTEEKIEAILPDLDEMIGGGLITLERAKVIMYRPDVAKEERARSWPIDITGSWETRGPERRE